MTTTTINAEPAERAEKKSGASSACSALYVVVFVIAAAIVNAAPRHVQLVIVVDGLRPDYVTPELMPRLSALAERGIRFNAHHSVLPTVTRVNASSMVTGAYPETHGLLGNTVYIPAVNATKGLDTGSRANLESIARASGPLLTAPTLATILPAAGKKLLAVGSGSSGAVFLLNDTVGTGAIIHQDFTRPASLAVAVHKALGKEPPEARPNAALNARAVDAYLKIGLPRIRPDVTLMWLSDPDHTAHNMGIGSAKTNEALRLVDAEIGRIEDALAKRGLADRTNIMVVSDHGFSTHNAHLKLAELVAPFAKPLADGSPDIVVAEGAINFRPSTALGAGTPPDAARVAAVVAMLQEHPEVGAIFTRAKPGGGVEGVVPGTLSFDVARWAHPRSAEILVSANWNADKNDAGYPGKTTATGVAGHGSTSPYDVHNTLIAAGPDFRDHAVSDVPTSNVDLAPTLLTLLGVTIPSTMTGRVIAEALRNGPPIGSVKVERSTETVKTRDGRYTLTAHFSKAAGKTYLDFTDALRVSDSTAGGAGRAGRPGARSRTRSAAAR